MFDFSAGAGGIFAPVKRLVGRVVGLIETRVELLSIELQEEKLRAVRVLIYAAVAVFLSFLSLFLLTLTVLLSVWDNPQYRLLGLLGLALFYAGGAIWAGYSLNRQLCHGPKPFAETLDQLKKDRECLKD